jgi:3-deoxy-manno-octulosonate cytidylyltransferase (CMP-KDO synthetase)
MRIAAIIPARYGSSRFPGKPLSKLHGRFLIQHVVDRALEARAAGWLDAVLVATDDPRIARAAEEAGARAVMTRADHPTGTDRLAEAAGSTDADVIVNIQGDEPLLPPEMVRDLIAPFHEEPRLSMGSVKTALAGPDALADPNQGKVVCDAMDFAVTFTRLPIPGVPAGAAYFHREEVERMAAFGTLRVFRTVGIYAYRREFLDVFAKLPPSPFERRERLEQLRALEHGVPVKVPTTRAASIEVNTPEDLVRAEAMFASQARVAREG